MSNTENSKSTFERLMQPAIVSARTGIWLGEAAYSGVNKVLPVTKFGRNVIHFVDKNRFVNYRNQNAARIEKDGIIKEFEQRAGDFQLVDQLAVSYTKVSLKEARAVAKEAVGNLDPEVHLAEVAQAMEDVGVSSKTIEIAVGKARDYLPQSVERRVFGLHDPAFVSPPTLPQVSKFDVRL